MVLSNTTWRADRNDSLRLYRALIISKLDYGCIVYGSARQSHIKRLDTIHNIIIYNICIAPYNTIL